MAFPTDKIYKFHSFNNNSITSLSSSKVWFSNLEQLNDPFEGAIEYIYPKTESEKISEYVKFFSKNISGKFGNDRAHEIAIEKYMDNAAHNAMMTMKDVDFLVFFSIKK